MKWLTNFLSWFTGGKGEVKGSFKMDAQESAHFEETCARARAFAMSVNQQAPSIETQLEEKFTVRVLPTKKPKWQSLDADLGKAKVKSNQALKIVKVKKK